MSNGHGTRYAKTGDVHIAYQVLGDGPIDVVVVPGWASNVEGWWDLPAAADFYERLGSFCRFIIFDKRGTGMSDRVSIHELPTLEQRMDDVRAVMDAAGFERAVLLGYSEGGPMSLLFAATYPERTTALVLHGSFAKVDWNDCFGRALGKTREEVEALVAERWGDGFPGLDVWAPSFADSEENRQAFARFMRMAASPAAAAALLRMFWSIDVSPILPTIHVPTLILHRAHERAIGVSHSRYMAERIPGAKYVQMPGNDHLLFAGDHEATVGEIEEFLTGARHPREPDRVLASVLFVDIVGSTERAAALGDQGWCNLLDRHQRTVRKELARFRGREVDTAGDGFFATFDGPARAIRCASSIRDAVYGLGIDIRAGVHTGECELMADKVAGIAVHIGARVMAQAGAGEVLVSGTTKDLVVGSGIQFRDRGAHALKGVPGEWRLYAVDEELRGS
jgi:pimeloyl-ACP methyl ester carboxylesterase